MLAHEDALLGLYSANDPKNVHARNAVEGAWSIPVRNGRRDSIHMDDRGGGVASWEDAHNRIYCREDASACLEVQQKGRGGSRPWDYSHPC